MKEVADDTYASIYGYDAGGERTVKFTGTYEWIDVNGSAQGFASLYNLTLYTSPYLVASQKGYTKHYYIENQRIASKLGNGGLQDLDNANQAMTVEEHEKRSAKVKAFKTGLSNTAQCLNLKHFDFVFKTNCPPPPNAAKFEPCLFQYMAVLEETEPDRYFYHPDHLGSASWITDADGKPIQHLGYLPFGEEFVDQQTSDWSAAYKFTGKEKDGETGYNFFGARYYMSDIGIFIGIDPENDRYPSLSGYNYCNNSPIILIDPDGRKIKPVGKSASDLLRKYLESYKGVNSENMCDAFSLKSSEGRLICDNEYSLSSPELSFKEFKTNYRKVTKESLNHEDAKMLYDALADEQFIEFSVLNSSFAQSPDPKNDFLNDFNKGTNNQNDRMQGLIRVYKEGNSGTDFSKYFKNADADKFGDGWKFFDFQPHWRDRGVNNRYRTKGTILIDATKKDMQTQQDIMINALKKITGNE